MKQITLKAARVNVGLTQKQAAKELQISEQTLSNYERGISYPDVPMVMAMENLYQVSYVDLDFRQQ